MDSVTISQPGKVVAGKLRLAELVRKPAGDGKFTSEFRMTRKVVPLGDGVELAEHMPPTPNAVWLNVTAEAARRHGWPHPANDKPKLGPADIGRLSGIVASDAFGQMERLAALRQLREIDPGLAHSLAGSFAWLESA